MSDGSILVEREHKTSIYDSGAFDVTTPLIEEDDIAKTTPVNDDIVGGAEEEPEVNGCYGKVSRDMCEFIVGASIFLIAFMAVIISVIIVVSTNNDNNKLIQFDDIFNSSFSPFLATPQWINSTAFTYADDTNCVMMFECSKNRSKLVMNFSVAFLGHDYTDYTVSPDGQLLLIEMDSIKVWRHSKRSTFLVYDPENGAKLFIGTEKKVASAIWSPVSGSNAIYSLAYVMNNDVYVDSFIRMPQLTMINTTRITFDGSSLILNGLNGWLYEEEVLSGGIKPIWWSPNGTYLSWLRTNESMVTEYSFPMYDQDDIYPTQKAFRYPKPGTNNPTVSLCIYSFADENVTNVAKFTNNDFYITYVVWIPILSNMGMDKPAMLVKWTNRAQNIENTVKVYPNGTTRDLFSRSHGGWVATHPVTVLGTSGSFVVLQPRDDKLQMALYNALDGSFIRWLTSDKFEVVSVVGYSPSSKLLYYQAAPSPLTRHIYSVSLTGGSPSQLTTPETGSWWSAYASTDASWLLYTNGGPKIPTQSLVDTKKNNLYPFQMNTDLANLLKKYNLPTISYVTAASADKKETLNAFILMPPKTLQKKKNPVVFTVYGGPGSQTVTKQFYSDMFHLYLASEGYIVCSVDGRGTGFRGESFMKQIYMKMGVMETEDQIAAARYLKNNNDNFGNMAIWGWSFGGYMSSRVMTHKNHSDVFQFGVAVAPPVDWRYYDSAYTERYMNLPKANEDGYEETSVLPNVTNMKPNTFLLIHGTADDNVHFMNSALLNDALVAKDIPFETMYYVNRDHSINVGNSRRHIYRLIKRFFDKKLKPETFKENPDL